MNNKGFHFIFAGEILNNYTYYCCTLQSLVCRVHRMWNLPT